MVNNAQEEKDDLDIESVPSEEEDYESSPAEYEISTYPADYTLEVLHEKWKAGDIEIPKFQRRYVWKQTQASKLIESFLVDLPVPAIFLYTERKSQKYLVIDGQQRLKTIFYFFEGFFGEEISGKREVFRLKGLSEKSIWSNKTFSDFDEASQRKLKNSVLRAFIVQQLDPKDDTSIYHIFERLNTGGTLLTNQEVRNCVYHGSFNDLIIQLNQTDNWRKILGKKKLDSRQKDVELILRFFALFKGGRYEKPLKDFVSKFMRKNRFISAEQVEELRNIFLQTCQQIIISLGEKPFHIRAGLNSSAFDAIMVSFAKNITNIPDDIRERYKSLLLSEEFNKVTTGATTDELVILKRLELAEKLFI